MWTKEAFWLIRFYGVFLKQIVCSSVTRAMYVCPWMRSKLPSILHPVDRNGDREFLTHGELTEAVAFPVHPVAVIRVILWDLVFRRPVAVRLFPDSVAFAALAFSSVKLPSESVIRSVSLSSSSSIQYIMATTRNISRQCGITESVLSTHITKHTVVCNVHEI